MMNKFTLVLGAAAVATLAGCKDPDYVRGDKPAAQNEAKDIDTTVVVEPAPAKCQCPPGTKHAEPCKCGASDCKCIVEQKPVIVADVNKPVVLPPPQPVVTKSVEPACKSAEPAYTIYVVQSGDYLAKISKKFNVTIASIKRLNPSIKKDVVRVGQKLKLPGKIDVGVQPAPAVKTVKAAKKGYTAYTGETKEYIVKSGDTLGAVAYGNGCNIRQLKELNGLTKDTLRVGQKLKIPAGGAVKKATKAADPAVVKKQVKAEVAAKAPAAPTKKPVAEVVPPQSKVEEPAAPQTEAKPASKPVAEPVVEAKPAAAEAVAPAASSTTTYVVQEGDDITGVSIRWGVTSAEIRELNNLGENDQLVPGQIIKLPAEAQQ